MSHCTSHNIPGHAHFLTLSCWRRQPFLLDPIARVYLAQSLDEARRLDQFAIWAYVFMPEHVHLLILPQLESYAMRKILRRIKEPAARQVLNTWRKDGSLRLVEAVDQTAGPVMHRFWQPGGGFDRNLHDLDVIQRAVDYIEWNPVRRGLVADAMDWEWSSARGRAGLADVPLKVDAIT